MILLSFLSCKYLETTFWGSRSEKLPFGHPVPWAHDIYLATLRCRLTLANPGQALDVYCSFRIDLIYRLEPICHPNYLIHHDQCRDMCSLKLHSMTSVGRMPHPARLLSPAPNGSSWKHSAAPIHPVISRHSKYNLARVHHC